MKGDGIFSIYVPHITLNLLTLFFAITILRRVNPRYTLAFWYLRMSNRLIYPYRTGYITETGISYDWGFWVYKSNELNWLYKHHRAKHNKPVGYLLCRRLIRYGIHSTYQTFVCMFVWLFITKIFGMCNLLSLQSYDEEYTQTIFEAVFDYRNIHFTR